MRSEALFPDTKSAAAALRGGIECALKEQPNKTILLLPGGNTIQYFYADLSLMHVDWTKVVISLTDERLVPTDHDLSNERQTREMFVSQRANMQFAELSDSLIQDLKENPYIAILSIGADGHIASLFASEQDDWADYKDALYFTKKQKIPRKSLPLKVLCEARGIFILSLGKQRLDNLLETLQGADVEKLINRAHILVVDEDAKSP